MTDVGNRNKTEEIKVRCTPEQKTDFHFEADKLRLSLSEFFFVCFVDFRARQEERLRDKKLAPLMPAVKTKKERKP